MWQDSMSIRCMQAMPIPGCFHRQAAAQGCRQSKAYCEAYLKAAKVNKLVRASAAFRSGLLPPKLHSIAGQHMTASRYSRIL